MAVFNPLPEGDPRFAENQRAYENRKMQAEFQRKAAEQKMYDDLIASKGFQPVQEDQADPIEKMRLQKMANPWSMQREPDASSKAMITPPPPTQMQAPVSGQPLPDSNNLDEIYNLPKVDSELSKQPKMNYPSFQIPKEQQALINDALRREQANADLQQANMRAYLQKGNTLDVGPMIALLDKTKGARISDAYIKGNKVETTDDIANSAAKMQDMAGKAQQAVADDQLKQLQNSTYNKALQQQSMQQNRFQQQDDMLQRRQDEIAHQKVLQSLNTNKDLAKMMANGRVLYNGLSLIAKTDYLTPQQLDETQLIIRRAAGGGGQSGQAERQATYLHKLGWDAQSIAQYLTGNPAEINKNEALVKHIKQLAQIEAKNIMDQSNGKINELISGNESVYAKEKYNKELKSRLNAIQNSQKGISFSDALLGLDEGHGSKQESNNNPVDPIEAEMIRRGLK